METKEYIKQWRKNNPEKVKGYHKEYRRKYPEKIREYNKRYYKENSEKINEYGKQWHKDNQERKKRYNKQWHINNKEHLKKYNKQWKKDNSEKLKANSKRFRENNPEYNKLYSRNRRKTDLKFNLNHRMSTAIGTSLRSSKAGRNWESLVGYTLKDLIKRLGKTTPKNYTWDDVLSGKLHIDHEIPISAFNFTKTSHTDFQRCWALSNLQLLPAKENIIKNAKITKPFQLALQI